MITDGTIKLRGITKADLPLFVRWLDDPEVRENLMMHPFLTQELEEKWFTDMLATTRLEEMPRMIELKVGEEWLPIGQISLSLLHWHDRSAELGIMIGEKQFWGKGYGSRAIRLLLDYGFNSLNLNRIALKVFETNLRGIKAYSKIGFVKEGSLRQGRYTQGRYIDIWVMSVLRSEWK